MKTIDFSYYSKFWNVTSILKGNMNCFDKRFHYNPIFLRPVTQHNTFIFLLTLSHKSETCLLNFKSEFIVIPRSFYHIQRRYQLNQH